MEEILVYFLPVRVCVIDEIVVSVSLFWDESGIGWERESLRML